MKAVVFIILGIATILAAAAPGPAASSPPGHDPKGLVILMTDTPDIGIVDAIRKLDYAVEVAPASANHCAAPASDLAALSSQAKARYPSLAHKAPILLGTGASARFVYQTLSQSPAGSFHAGISLNVCPSTQPPCPDGEPPRHLPANWYVFQGALNCDRNQASRFIGQMDNAKWVDVPPNDKNPVPADLTALLQWLDPGIAHQTDHKADVAGVPLTEIRASGRPTGDLAILLSGDGGWAAIDRGISAELAKRGVDVVGWDSLSYYWTAKTPEQAARDMERVIDHYVTGWHARRVMLIGYSFGADALPYLVDRLPPESRAKLGLVAFIGLSGQASFEFHLSDWLNASNTGQWPTQPEIRKLQGINRLCLYGSDEDDTACPGLESAGVKVVRLEGDHHFGEHYNTIVDHLLAAFGPAQP